VEVNFISRGNDRSVASHALTNFIAPRLSGIRYQSVSSDSHWLYM